MGEIDSSADDLSEERHGVSENVEEATERSGGDAEGSEDAEDSQKQRNRDLAFY